MQGVYKRKPFTEEHKKNIGDARRGMKVSKEISLRMSRARKIEWATGVRKAGWFQSEEWKQRMSQKKMGNRNYAWKGGVAWYYTLHKWKRKCSGNPSYCEHCGIAGEYSIMKNGVKRWSIHWANKSHKYLRDLSDWLGLCVKCHFKYDLNFKKV